MVLNDNQAALFKKAVKQHYWYELFMDELPVWGFVGLPPEEAKEAQDMYIYTHKSFEINYNGDRVRSNAKAHHPLRQHCIHSVGQEQ